MRISDRPSDPSWGIPPFPDWVKAFRPEQLDAAREIESLFLGGANVVFLDAPTGAGKTLVGEMVRRRQRRRSMYLCTTKTLQDQFVTDFPYAKLIKGRNNYPVHDHPEQFGMSGIRHLSAADCTKTRELLPACSECPVDWDHQDEGLHCHHCHPWESCPYELAKGDALSSNLVIANTSYFLHEANSVGRFGAGPVSSHRTPAFEFIVIDEADSLEQELMRYVELVIPKRTIQRLNLPIPDKKTVSKGWPQWALQAEHVLRNQAAVLSGQAHATNPPDRDRLRQFKRISLLADRVKEVGPQLNDGTWIYSGYDQGQIVMRPVKVDKQAHDALWRHGKQFLLMSATIISPEQMAADLGLPRGTWGSVRTPSAFPIERRPVIIRPVANMTAKTKEDAWPKMLEGVRSILFTHPSERILVHTVSYALTEYLERGLNQPRVIAYSEAGQRDAVLNRFRSTPNAVLLAPSFDRGVDLPDDECRVIVITKIPFPYLGDKQVSARLYSPGGDGWYRMQTVRSMVQMSGRGMRHEGDACRTYILDRQFLSNIWRNSASIIPAWWKEAIEWEAP